MTRPIGSASELEARRRRALQLLQEGWRIKDIAAHLGVSRQSVSSWKRAIRTGRLDQLAAKPQYRRPCRLTVQQRIELASCLRASPELFGFSERAWTTARVADLIRTRFEVSYHPDHVGRLLHQMGFISVRRARMSHSDRVRSDNPDPLATGWISTGPTLDDQPHTMMREVSELLQTASFLLDASHYTPETTLQIQTREAE